MSVNVIAWPESDSVESATLVECSHCGTPTDPENIDEGWCLACAEEEQEYLRTCGVCGELGEWRTSRLTGEATCHCPNGHSWC